MRRGTLIDLKINSMFVTTLFRRIVLFLLLCFALNQAVLAGEDFEQGVKLAKQGAYHQALDYFERIYNRGEVTPNLLYNLASCNYRLGRFTDAHNYFSQLLNDKKFQALAAYNMGLIEAKLGDDVAAIHSFQHSLRLTDASNHDLIKLNLKALKIISKRNAGYLKNGGNIWFSSVAFSLAYDSNPQLLANDLLQIPNNASDADMLTTATVTSQAIVQGNRKRGVKLGAYFNRLRYQSVDADSTLYSMALSRLLDTRSSLHTETSFEWGRQHYLTYIDTFYSARYSVSSRLGEHNRAELRYRYRWVEPALKTEYWRGSEYALRTRFSIGELGNRVNLDLNFALNRRSDKKDEQPISYSPTRYGYAIGYGYKKLRDAYWFSYEYRVSQFNGDTLDTVDIAGVPSDIIIQRHDRKKAINFAYRYSLNRHAQLSLTAYRQLNSSNRTLSNYQQTLIGTDVTMSF